MIFNIYMHVWSWLGRTHCGNKVMNQTGSKHIIFYKIRLSSGISWESFTKYYSVCVMCFENVLCLNINTQLTLMFKSKIFYDIFHIYLWLFSWQECQCLLVDLVAILDHFKRLVPVILLVEPVTFHSFALQIMWYFE